MRLSTLANAVGQIIFCLIHFLKQGFYGSLGDDQVGAGAHHTAHATQHGGEGQRHQEPGLYSRTAQ